MKYALTLQDGSVAIMTLVKQEDGEWPELAEVVRKFNDVAANGKRAVSHRQIDAEDVPADRTFREAWRDGGAAIEHDMPACRAIWKEKMRQARKPLLSDLDVAYQRADEAGDSQEKQNVALEKQALRDVTSDPAIEAAATVEELKAVWPDILKAKN